MKKHSMMLAWWLVTALIGLFFPLIDSPMVVAQEEPVARFLLFYDEACPVCRQIMDEYLPTVYEKYGDQVEYCYLEIGNNPENHRAMRGLLLKLNVPKNRRDYVPALIIGDQWLVGDEIPAQLGETIEQHLAQGGVDFASLEDLPQPVQIAVFYDIDDADFARLDELIRVLADRYDGWLQTFGHALSQADSAELLARYNAALNLPVSIPGAPHVLVGRRMLVGMEEIESQLPGLIEEYKTGGGVEIPVLEESETAEPTQKRIYLAYFEEAGCQKCARTTYELRLVQDDYPQLIVETFLIEEYKVLNEWLCQKYDVPEEKRLTTPMVFVGDEVLTGDDVNLGQLTFTVARYASIGAERTWDDFDEAGAEQQLIDRFKSFGLLTVLGAGLIDGLNPCAFATLVFFISYLTFTGRRGRDVLFVGGSFALGVFLTYLLVGVGLLRVVQSLSFFTALGRWVYLATALLCAILALLTFRDFFKVRRGQAGKMTLKLPAGLQRLIHKVIRENAQVRAFVAVAFFTGFVVSLIELACTGQVYLPTIMFVLSVPGMVAQAFLYLLLYCLMFILPLIVVFLSSYLGTTSYQLGLFVNRHTAAIKFLTGLLFVGLALWMTWTLSPLFGISIPWNQLR